MNFYMTDIWFLVPNWKWVIFLVAATSGFIIQALLKQVFAKIKSSARFKEKANNSFVHHFTELPIEGSLSWILTGSFWMESVDLLALPEGLAKYLRLATHVLMAFYCIRLSYLAVDALGNLLEDFTKKTENTLDDQLAPFVTKSLKVLVVVIGILIILQNFGFNVISLLAGLSLGGLALALAAQETAANVFGSITLILDRPFQVGDWVKIGDTEGTIEEIGFRSTRIRTFYQSLVTIPNSVTAKEKIDNMGVRPRRRVRHTMGFTYDSSEEQLKSFMDKMRYLLLQHPLVFKDDITLRFNAMGDFSLQVLMNFFVNAADTNQELEIQQEILFEAMRTAKELRLEFAFPTSTVHYLHQQNTPVPRTDVML